MASDQVTYVRCALARVGRRCLANLGVACALSINAVMAETSPLTKTAPSPAFRIVSDCIGAPRSPKCTIETYLACFERRDPQLCAIVDVPDEPARVELGLRLIGLAIPKSYSIDYFSKADSDHPQRPRFI